MPRHPNAPPFPIGTRVRYIGREHVQVAVPNPRPGRAKDWVDVLVYGLEVEIVDITNGRRGTAEIPGDVDGTSIYCVPGSAGERVILRKDARRWRVLTWGI